jgi:thiosulfate reductase cytochrome b subunit
VTSVIRRGLPRVPGGEPWPPASLADPDPAPTPAPAPAPHPDQLISRIQDVSVPDSPDSAGSADLAGGVAAGGGAAGGVRRGLPRVPGGEPWPPASLVAPAPAAPIAPAAAAPEPEPEPRGPRAPLPFSPTVFPGVAAREWDARRRGAAAPVRPEPRRLGPFTAAQWVGAGIVGVVAIAAAAAMVVLLVRVVVSLDGVRDFLATHPGEYPLPEGAPVGIPAWLGWQHFFNVFLIVLIIRSGLQVRREKRPTVFWSPRGNKRRRISLALWFHQSLDILWLVNGVVFVVLLFVTGQWMRIVPTSWEVFPNALSALLQYASLDWPTENGWVNYNSLQQLAYFATVFLAAPLATVTGVRMSGVWPKNATTLNRLYPVEWARAVHFPVMIFFVLFIVVHVTLVFATGALRNLNHMYAAQDAVNGWGFGIFVASLVVIVAGWVAARPLVLAPIARLFGTVKGR